MRSKWKTRAIAWVLSIVMILTSVGMDSLPVLAAESKEDTVSSEIVSEPVSEETPEISNVRDTQGTLASVATGGAFTYTAEFSESFTTAEMTFKLGKIGENDPDGNNNIDVYIKLPSEEEYTQDHQIAWYKNLDSNNQVVLSDIKYKWQSLTPGATYNVKIALRHDNTIVGEAETSFTTKAVTVTRTEKLLTWFSAEYELAVAEKEALQDEGISVLKVYPYIQEKGGEPVKANVGGDGIDLLKDNLKLSGLKDDTEYTVYFAGTRDKYQPYLYTFDFKTSKDTRTLKLMSEEIQYCYASFHIAVSGGRDDVDTKSYLFLRKKGDTEWRNQKQNDQKEAFSKDFRINELDPLTEYEYVLAIGDDWNINDPDLITKEGHKITGEFKTPEDPRELKTVCSAGYQTALIKASYTENNLSGVQSVIHVFVREKGTEEWVEAKNASYDQGNSFDLVFKDLKQDTEYEYRAILNSKWDNTTADDKVLPLQYEEGTFHTRLCEYVLKMTPDTQKSLYNREYLNVQLEGSKNDREVDVAMLFNNEYEKKLSLYRDENYKDTFSIRGLSSDTTYYLAEYSLYVKEYGEYVCIKKVTCSENDYTFTTPVAVAPVSVKFEKETIYLNMAQAEEENVGNVTLKPIVNAGASDEMLWESLDPSIAEVDENGKVTAGSVGETKIIATSKYDANVKAEILISVGSFEAVYADSKETVGDNTVKGLKGTESAAIILNGTDSETEEPTTVQVTGYSADRNSVAGYNIKTGTIAFGTVGTTRLYLHHGEYKVRIYTESYIRTAAYYVSSLSNAEYPAVPVIGTENTYDLAEGQTYQIHLKSVNGSEITDYSSFTATVESDPNHAVSIDSESFQLTANSVTASPVKITVSPKEGSAYDNEYYADAVVYVNVKAIPEENDTTMYVYTNEDKFLSDVELEDGWKWKNEKIALYVLRKTQTYDFEAYYAKEDGYPVTQTISVALAELKNFTVEDLSKTNYTVTADGTDKIQIKISYSYVGKINKEDLSKNLKSESEDCVIELVSFDESSAIYEVSVTKPGTYTLDAGVWSDAYRKTILGSTIAVNAVETPCVRSMKVQNTSKEPAEFLEEDKLLLDAAKDIGTTINLKAFTYDYAENEVDAPKLIWTTTDKTVAQITPAGKNDTQNAKLLIKGEGNAIITVKSTDAAGASYSFIVEVKNIAPHVDGNKVSVNTALDYTISEGREIAYKYYGFTEIVEAYDNKVTDWKFYQKTQKTFAKEQEKGLAATVFNFYERMGVGDKRDILIMPADADLKSGKYEMWLVIETEAGSEAYAYPVTVTVMNKPMKVKAVSDNINTFYMLKENDDIAYTFTGDYINNPTVNWIDDAKEAVGFGVSKYIYYNETKKKWCSHVDTSTLEMDGKVPAAGTTTGTLEFLFKGYRDTVKIEKFKIKNCYKIPAIVAVNAQTTISTECEINKASFYLYQKDVKKRIQYHDQESKYFYSSYKSNIEEVNVYPTSDYSDYMEYEYTGEKKVENLVISLRSQYWREKVEVKHTIKNVSPILILEKSTMTFNWNLPGMDTTVLKVKNAQNGAVLKDVIVTGKNAETQKLIDDNVFTFTLGDQKYLDVKLNSLKALNKKFTKDATYSFQVTPVYVNTVTGKEVQGKACILKIKTTPKNPEVSVSASGSIDLAKYPMMDSWEFYKNAIKLKYTFKNVNSNYEVIGREVVGDYAKYFEIWWSDAGQGWYLVPKRGMEGRLKAGFVYNLQFKFTLKMKDGETTEIISSKPYKLKMKQSVTGVKVTPKSQIIYLSNENVTRDYEVTLNSGYYRIEGITGSLDVNKDGKADIVIEKVQTKSGDRAADITIRLVDRDAVSTTLKGKNYTIPVEIMVSGADGVSKNIKTSITVTVKK